MAEFEGREDAIVQMLSQLYARGETAFYNKYQDYISMLYAIYKNIQNR